MLNLNFFFFRQQGTMKKQFNLTGTVLRFFSVNCLKFVLQFFMMSEDDFETAFLVSLDIYLLYYVHFLFPHSRFCSSMPIAYWAHVTDFHGICFRRLITGDLLFRYIYLANVQAFHYFIQIIQIAIKEIHVFSWLHASNCMFGSPSPNQYVCTL